MDRNPIRLLLLLFVLPALCAGAASAGNRFEKKLTHEEMLPAGARLNFDNLIGSIKLLPGRSGTPLLVEAQVVTEADSAEKARALAESLTLERRQVPGEVGIHVAYPVKRHASFKLPRSEKDGLLSKWVTPLVRKSTVSVEYDGRMVEVGSAKGAAAVAVHVEVTLPLDLVATIRQTVGTIQCTGLRTSLDLQIVHGDAIVEQIFGDLRARTGGGGLHVWKHHGEVLDLQTGTGEIEVLEVNAGQLNLLSGAGMIHGGNIQAGVLRVETDTGNVELDDVKPESFEVVTASGNVELGMPLARTSNGSIESGSGDVTLRVGRLAPFDLLARTQSGAVKTQDLEVELLAQDEEGSRYRRRNGGIDLRVTTGGKGKILVRPL
jgi:hypothetical protein